MIYLLPTKGKPYRGKYPLRIRMVSSSGMTVHVERNDGQRFVMRAAMLRDLPRCGTQLDQWLRDPATKLRALTPAMHKALRDAANAGMRGAVVLGLLQRWDSVWEAEIN